MEMLHGESDLPHRKKFGQVDRKFRPVSRIFGRADGKFGSLDRKFRPPNRFFRPLDRKFGSFKSPSGENHLECFPSGDITTNNLHWVISP